MCAGVGFADPTIGRPAGCSIPHDCVGGTGHTPAPQTSLSLPGFSQFCWGNTFQCVVSLGLTSRVLRKFVLAIFCLCSSYCVSGGMAFFRGSNSTISYPISLFLVLSLRNVNHQEMFIWETSELGSPGKWGRDLCCVVGLRGECGGCARGLTSALDVCLP